MAAPRTRWWPATAAQALTDARTAAARDPLSPQPLWTEADVLAATGDLPAARPSALKARSTPAGEPGHLARARRSSSSPTISRARRSASLTRAHQLDPTYAATDQAINQAQIAARRAPERDAMSARAGPGLVAALALAACPAAAAAGPTQTSIFQDDAHLVYASSRTVSHTLATLAGARRAPRFGRR